MDPVTHAVIGMSISKITGNGVSLSDAATMGIVIGSIFPDADILLQKWGDYVYLKNHRGASHSVLGLIASSFFIALLLGSVCHNNDIIGIFGWTLLGCLSHSFFDLFNSYGAKILWPLSNKKFTFSLLLVVDPIFTGALIGYIMTGGTTQYLFLTGFILYLTSRIVMRGLVSRDLVNRFGRTCKKISILPSMTGLFRWHFILEEEDCNVVGEENILKRSIKIMKKLYKLQDDTLDRVIITPLGEFFSEFTPLFHVAREKVGRVTRYIFIDMRYYMKKNFLHHAVLEVDENNRIVRSSFNPYSIHRSEEIGHRLRSFKDYTASESSLQGSV